MYIYIYDNVSLHEPTCEEVVLYGHASWEIDQTNEVY